VLPSGNTDRTTLRTFLCGVSLFFVGYTSVAWAEDRALLGSNLSAVPGAKIGDWGGNLSPPSFPSPRLAPKRKNPGVWGRAPVACLLISRVHSVASNRHSA